MKTCSGILVALLLASLMPEPAYPQVGASGPAAGGRSAGRAPRQAAGPPPVSSGLGSTFGAAGPAPAPGFLGSAPAAGALGVQPGGGALGPAPGAEAAGPAPRSNGVDNFGEVIPPFEVETIPEEELPFGESR